MYAKVYGTVSAIKKFLSKYAKHNFNRTTVNSWKAKCKIANPTFKKAGRPNLLDETLLKKGKRYSNWHKSNWWSYKLELRWSYKMELEQTIPMR